MATSIDSMIANTKSYADAAISDANLIMMSILEDLPVILNQLTFLTKIKPDNWDYTDIGSWADNMYDSVVADNPDTLYPTLLTSIGSFTPFKPLTYSSDIIDLAYIRTTIMTAIDEMLELPDRFAEACLAFDALNAYITAGVAGAISPSASAVLASGTTREGLIQTQILTIPLTKFSPAPYAGAVTAGAAQAGADGAVGITQIGDLVAHKTLELQRRARAFWLKIALDSAVAQSGLNKDKYTTLVSAVDAILELGKAEIEEGDIEFKINELRFRKDEAYSKVLETLRATHFQRWGAQFGIATRAYSVLQQANMDQLRRDAMVISSNHEIIKAQLAEFKLGNEVRSQALKASASLLGQKVSGALASLNTLVGQIEELTEA